MPARDLISDQLRETIAREPGSLYALAEAAGVPRQTLGRFVAGERALTQGSIDKIAKALGLRLIQVRRRGRKA